MDSLWLAEGEAARNAVFDHEQAGSAILEPNAKPAIVTQALARRFRDLVAVTLMSQ